MYQEFNELINQYDTRDKEKTMDWYEYESKFCQQILNKFSDEDWKSLIKDLPEKSNIVKERLAECLRNPDNIYHNIIILELLKIDDIDLFTQILCVLIPCDYNLSFNIINDILKRIETYTPIANEFQKIRFNLYIKKLKNQFGINKITK